MGWAEDEVNRRREEAERKQGEAFIQNQIEEMSIAPMNALWEKFRAVHKALPEELQMEIPNYKYSPFYSIGPFIFIHTGIRRIEFSRTYLINGPVETLKIFYDHKTKGYEICGDTEPHRYSRWRLPLPFFPEYDVEIIFKAIVLKWDIEQLRTKLSDESRKQRARASATANRKKISFWERIFGY